MRAAGPHAAFSVRHVLEAGSASLTGQRCKALELLRASQRPRPRARELQRLVKQVGHSLIG